MEKKNIIGSFTKSIISSLYENIINLTNDCIIQCGKNPDDYIITPYPLSLKRKDGKVVEPDVLKQIISELSKGAETKPKVFGVLG